MESRNSAWLNVQKEAPEMANIYPEKYKLPEQNQHIKNNNN